MNIHSENRVVWFFHHYATPPRIIGLTRPYDLSKKLQSKKYKCSVFSSSYLHYAGYDIKNDSSLLQKCNEDGVDFYYVKTNGYKCNKISRVINMISFARNLSRAAKKISKEEKPDVIIASSPHPLTCLAGIRVARKLKVPCIVEIRDLWPESIISYSFLKKKTMLARLLYRGEKYIYKKADSIIFTMEGGAKYIQDKKWDKNNSGTIDLDKVFHINNGVDIETFDHNILNNRFDDDDLADNDSFKVVYTGTIRKVNNIKLLIDTAEYIKSKDMNHIKLFIYGEGSEKDELEMYCQDNNIDNVYFKGNVEKKYIPYILSCADLNILNYLNKDVWKYGGSQNKVFEYLASGKPILSTIKSGYDIVEKFGAGISLNTSDFNVIGNAIIEFANLSNEKYLSMCENARMASYNYDYSKLAMELDCVISKSLIKRGVV